MATTNLGKVSVTPKGEYDPLVTYERLDVISHNGSSYIVKQTSTGVTPIEGEFYALIAEKGDGGSFVKKAYKTYAAMDADKVNIPANSSVDVTNDPDESKNGAYIYDGVAFTRSQYDSKVVTDKIIADTAIAVNEAINSTAIEGGILADTFVTVNNSLNQRQINMGLASIYELLSLPNKSDGLRVGVKSFYTGKGKGEASYIWSATEDKANANGGTVLDPDTLSGFDGTSSTISAFLTMQGTGIGVGCWVMENPELSTQYHFGVVGDKVADDTQPIKSFILHGGVSAAQGEHYISGGIQCSKNKDLSRVHLFVDGSMAVKGFRVVPDDESQLLKGITVHLPAVTSLLAKSKGSDFIHDDIGIEIKNIAQCNIHFPAEGITGFREGFVIHADRGVAYNTFYDPQIFGCKRSLVFRVRGTGYITENTFNNPQLNLWGNRNALPPTGFANDYEGNYTIVIDSTNETTINHNVFIKPVFEHLGSREFDIYFETPSAMLHNTFVSGRYEVYEKYKIGGVEGYTCTNTYLAGDQTGKLPLGSNSIYASTGVRTTLPVVLGGGGNHNSSGIYGYRADKLPDTVSDAMTAFSSATSVDLHYRLNSTGLRMYSNTANIATLLMDETGISLYDPTVTDLAAITDRVRMTVVGSKGSQTLSVYCGAITRSTLPANLGIAARRWSNIYSETELNVTSDSRYKQDVRSLDNKELAVSVKLRKLIKLYKLNEAVAQKGDEARLHCGVIAQEVITAFESEGLDPYKYGIVCHDSWDAVEATYDEDGTELTSVEAAGDMYSIRYSELIMFILATL